MIESLVRCDKIPCSNYSALSFRSSVQFPSIIVPNRIFLALNLGPLSWGHFLSLVHGTVKYVEQEQAIDGHVPFQSVCANFQVQLAQIFDSCPLIKPALQSSAGSFSATRAVGPRVAWGSLSGRAVATSGGTFPARHGAGCRPLVSGAETIGAHGRRRQGSQYGSRERGRLGFVLPISLRYACLMRFREQT
ncbi:hypothetical protein EUGRSUZ_G01231 [Eucalyptus grandis]|uniref:Uncharacterized protein n=2 Tax=Eucalyptus grandis TaxID=71139 RepID=A0ACC3K292_EUCGR|nr:hypothetical protein EUGRSUZ_G01231 [Eucalyptus grandis]